MIFIVAGQLLSGCVYDRYDDTTGPVTYNKDIKSLIVTSCAIEGCHVRGFPPGDFASFSTIREKILKGTFWQLVIKDRIMPPGKKLSETQIDLIEKWLNAGYPEN